VKNSFVVYWRAQMAQHAKILGRSRATRQRKNRRFHAEIRAPVTVVTAPRKSERQTEQGRIRFAQSDAALAQLLNVAQDSRIAPAGRDPLMS
jgi:hypothetical protein